MAKGQAEVVIVAAFVIIGVVVLLFAFLPNIIQDWNVPISEEQKVVRQSVENFLKQASTVSLREVSLNGGYYRPSSVVAETFNGRNVYYWLPSSKPEDIKIALRKAISDYIRENKGRLEAALAEKNVTIGDLDALELEISDNAISIKASMPTRVKGFSIPQPYSAQIPTKVKDSFELAGRLADYQYNSKFFENSTIINTFSTNYVEGVKQVPLNVVWTKCDRPYSKGYQEMSFWMKDVIARTLKGTYMPGKAPENVAGISGLYKFLLPAFSNKKYAELDVDFFLPPDFSLDESNFHFRTSNGKTDYIFLQATPSGKTCKPDSTIVSYTFSYPIVVTIRDPFTENRFSFALKAAIEDNQPSKRIDVGGGLSSQYDYCNNMACNGNVFVLDKDSGKGVENAYISFGGCYLGQTDKKGIFEGRIPCLLAGTLEASSADYEKFEAVTGTTQLKGYSLRLKKLQMLKVYFHKVDVKNDSSAKTYAVKKAGYNQNPVTLTFNWLDRSGGKPYTIRTESPSGRTNVPTGFYMVTGTVGSKDGKAIFGSFSEENFEIKQDTSELHVYLPVFESPYDANDLTKVDKLLEMTAKRIGYSRVLKKCGMGPVSLTDVAKEFCIIKHEDV